MPKSVVAGISTMISYATISDDYSQGWQNSFNDGDTVVVNTTGVTSLILSATTVNIQAIRLDTSLSFLGNDAMLGTKSNVINIGSIYGDGNSVQTIYAGGLMSNAGQIWTLSGNAGEDDNPIQNNYSGIQLIHFVGKSTFNLEAPITLESEFQIASGELDVTINVNDNITIVAPSITSIGFNGKFNIAAGKLLTLSGSEMNLTSQFNFSDSGILTLNGDNTIFNPSVISNVDNAVLNIDNNVTTDMSSVLTINTINIADGKSLTIDAVNSDIDLLDNNASINFGSSGTSLVLTNSGTSDRLFTVYNALTGNVLFSSTSSSLIVNNGVDGSITTTTDNTGTITIGSGDVGDVGAADKKLKLVNLNQDEAASVGALYATSVNIGGAGPITATDLITAAVSFSSTGTLVANGGITGDIDFAGSDGVLQLADDQTITGSVDSTSASAGTLEFLGKGTVTGSIGATNALTALKFSGAGAITVPAANAGTYEVANAGAVVTASDLLTGNVLFSSTGSLVADKGITGDIDFTGNDGVLQLADDQTITGNVDSATASAGTLEFLGKGTVTGSIGATNALTALKFSGAGSITVPAANAGTYEVANAGAVVTASDLLTGNVLFSSTGSLVADKGVDGSITTSTDNTGTITIGSGDVGVIGAEDKKLKLVNLNQGEAASVGELYTTNVDIGGIGPITATDLITAAVSFSSEGILIADKGIIGDVDFGSNAASLIFDGDAGDDGYTLDGTISNADNALLEVDTKLRVIDKGIGEIKTINIGEGGILSIESNEANLSLISATGGSINFADDNAQLILSVPQNQTINFAASIEGSDNSGGTILLDGNGYNLTITLGDDAFLGTEDKRLSAINVSGNVIFDASVGANVSSLNINNGAYLTDYSAAAESIDSINIGNSDGAGQYVLDARDSDFSISSDNISFKNEDSVLALGISSEDEERTITLETSIVPSQDKYGVLTLYSTGDKKLTIDNNGDDTITIGAAATRLKQLILSSDGDAEFDIRPAINVESLGLDLSKIDLGEVDANIIFHKDTQYNANGDINGSVDFAGQDGVINVADNVNINGSVSSTDSTNGTLNFLGSSTIDGVVSNISIMYVGAGDVIFVTSGDYSIGELQGNGSGIITFPSGMNFTGGINTTAGDPLNLSFADSTNINGNIGSSSSPVGNISSSNNTQFNGDINSSGDVITSGTTVFAGNVTCNNIVANNTSSNTLSLITLTSALSTSSGNTINFDEANAVTQFQGSVNTTGNIEVNSSTYFADTVNSGGNIVINGDTKFNKTLLSNNDISISSGSNVIFNGDVNSSSITIDNANIGIIDNISMHGNINASNSSILLDNNTLTLSGSHAFSDQITISSTYDESSLSGGNIILTSGSTLDLSNVSQLIIKLAFINSDISNITDDTKYNIILAEDGSNIVLLSDPENQIILDSSEEQNRFVKWTLDASSLTLYASDDSDNVIDNDYVFDSVQNNTFMQELKNASSDSLAQEFKNNIGLLSKEQVEDMFSWILDHPKERSSDIVQVVLHQALTDTNRTAMNVIHDRLLSTGPSQAIASAGDEEDVSKYGIWARSSITQSKDKVNRKRSEYFSSYKTRGHSNTIGADSLICDNLLVGAAYTNAYTSIRPKDQNIGNVDKVRTNMFSLYSAYNIPNYNWYLDGTVSYAESSVRGKMIRYLAVARDVLGSEVASSKYKSRLYSGNVSVGYNHYIRNNAYVTPSIGAIGSLIRDRGYIETGTSFQNLTVRKKSYNELSGNAGLRTYQNIYLDNNVDDIIVTPEVYGFVNYNIKNKSPAIDARLTGIDQPLPTISHRSNRVDCNLGLGITIKQNMMEYGINYDANLAKKYQGHSGSLKLRVNL